jgi:hypothetical protein
MVSYNDLKEGDKFKLVFHHINSVSGVKYAADAESGVYTKAPPAQDIVGPALSPDGRLVSWNHSHELGDKVLTKVEG